jgi:hypothetical protein
MRFLESQGALARAARLDHTLRGDDSTLVVDEKVYQSGVDISRPISAGWTYAATASESKRGFAITMLLLVVLRIAWALGLDQVGGWISQKVIASSPGGVERVPWFWRRLRVRWALLATVLVLGVPAAWGLPGWPAMVVVMVTCAIVSTPLAARAVAAQPGEARHFGWTPAVVVGFVGAPFGVSFAPYPALDDGARGSRWIVRWSPTLAMTGVVTVLTVAAAWSSLPYLRTSAMLSLVLLASMLIPAPPFDGNRVTSRAAQLSMAGALAVVSLAYVMKWI